MDDFYKSLEAKFNDTYEGKIKPLVEAHEDYLRKTFVSRHVGAFCFIVFCISFCMTAIFGILSAHPLSFTSFTVNSLDIGLIIENQIFPVSLVITIVSCICMFYLFLRMPKDPLPYTEAIRELLNIFSAVRKYYKGQLELKNEKLKVYRKLNIFNSFPFAIFDDNIRLVHNGIYIEIYEFNTRIFTFASVFIITFCSLFIFAFFGIIYLVILLAVFPIICVLYVLYRIFKHSPFVGVVVEVRMNKNFEGHTFFLNKAFASNKISINRKIFSPVELESKSFMDKYKIYSTDQVEARYLLTPAMIERLDNLNFTFNANYIRGAFKDDKLVLAINTKKDMFKIAMPNAHLNFQMYKETYDEIVSVMKIVDQLKLNIKTGL